MLNKSDFIKKVADKLNVKPEMVKTYLDAICETVLENIKEEKVIKINIGQFILKTTPERKGRDFSRGIDIVIPSKDKLAFEVSKKVQENI